jgi:peptidoglycan/xylan/chitin deacetylase (PgdA/CDA1 family)
MTHAYLTDLDDRGLQREIGDAKAQLEEILGKTVEHFSCPGGRCDARVIEVARRAGYSSVANSRVHPNRPTTDSFDLGRISILREMKLSAFQELCKGEGVWKIQVRERLRSAAKQILGNSLYDRGRAFLLR